MPYAIKKRAKAKRPYAIIRKSDGKTVGSSMSKKMAESAITARYMGEMRKAHKKSSVMDNDK